MASLPPAWLSFGIAFQFGMDEQGEGFGVAKPLPLFETYGMWW